MLPAACCLLPAACCLLPASKANPATRTRVKRRLSGMYHMRASGSTASIPTQHEGRWEEELQSQLESEWLRVIATAAAAVPFVDERTCAASVDVRFYCAVFLYTCCQNPPKLGVQKWGGALTNKKPVWQRRTPRLFFWTGDGKYFASTCNINEATHGIIFKSAVGDTTPPPKYNVG